MFSHDGINMKYVISIFFVSLFLFIVISVIVNDPFLKAKVNLFLAGQYGCRTVSPIFPPEAHHGGFDTYLLVYKNDTYIGYIDRYGCFISKKAKGHVNWFRQLILIHLIRYFWGFLALVLSIPVSWHFWNYLLSPRKAEKAQSQINSFG